MMAASAKTQSSVAWPPPGIGAETATASPTGPAASAAASGPETHQPGEAKRFRDRDYGPRGPLTGFQELADAVRRMRQQQEAHHLDVKEAFNDHAARIDALESQDLQYNDRIAFAADYCTRLTRDTDAALRGQLDEYNSQLKANMVELKVGLETTFAGTREEFVKFRGDAKQLMDQIDLKIIQIQAALTVLQTTSQEQEAQIVHLHGAVGDLGDRREPLLKEGVYNADAQHFAIGTPANSPCRAMGPAGSHPTHGGTSGIGVGVRQGQQGVGPAG